MPNFYLLRPDGTFTHFGDYPEQPAEREDGEWVAGDPAGLVLHIPKPVTLADRLDAVFSQQDIDLQAHFSTLRTTIKLELDQGRFAIAKRVIEMAAIPEELESQREALLNLFQEA